MNLRSCSLALSVLVFSVALSTVSAAQSGVTAAPGMIYTEKPTEDIAMNNALIEFNRFYEMPLQNYHVVSLAEHSALYELQNTANDYKNLPVIFPVNFYFTEFGSSTRSKILDDLFKIIPDFQDAKGDAETVKQILREKFKQRPFIRTYLNPKDLIKLQTDVKIYKDEEEVRINKIMLEIKYVVDDISTKKEVLHVAAYFYHSLPLSPKQMSLVKVKAVTPAFTTGAGSNYYYAPFVTGTARNWKGKIGQLYFAYTLNQATLVAPYYMNIQPMSFQHDKTLIKLINHEPEKFEKIGFYTQRGSGCHCGTAKATGFPDKVSLPAGLKRVTASSWHKDTGKETDACYQPANDYVLAKWVPDFDIATDMPSVLKEPLKLEEKKQTHFQDLLLSDCEGDRPFINFMDQHHPVWAFDVGIDSVGRYGTKDEGNFSLNTAWCEGSSGNGIGQYLEFEITQPVDYIKFYTGYQHSDEEYEAYARVKFFELQGVTNNYEKLLIFSDQFISSSYDVFLQPGTYRLVIKDVYPGKEQRIACFADIQLHFTVEDNWLNTNYFKYMREQ